MGERLSLVFPNVIVADAQVIDRLLPRTLRPRDHAHHLRRYAPGPRPAAGPRTARSAGRVQPGRYLLYVSRLEPENQADLVIRAYADVPGDTPLLIVGDAPYAAEYKSHLARLAAADPRVRMVGGMYGEAYTDLQRAAMAYIQATSVGGTHPALIESMAAGNLVLAFGTPENREVTAGTALIFDDQAELTDALTQVVAGARLTGARCPARCCASTGRIDLLLARHRRPLRVALRMARRGSPLSRPGVPSDSGVGRLVSVTPSECPWGPSGS